MREGIPNNNEAKKEKPRQSPILAAVLAATLSGALSDAAEAKAPRTQKEQIAKPDAKELEQQARAKRAPGVPDLPKSGLRRLLVDGTPAQVEHALFDKDTVLTTVAEAYAQYSSPWGKRVVDGALNNMEHYWVDQKEEFARLGIPEWCLYLSIVESGYDNDRVSGARATGVFQFTKDQGKTSRLVRKERDHATGKVHEVDERRNIVKSGEAAAALLKRYFDIHKRKAETETDAWLLALSQYNGSFSYQYYLQVPGKTSYMGFVQYMDARMRERVGQFSYAMLPSETVASVARRFYVSEERLRAANPDIGAETLVIPPVDATDLWYDVRGGDSLTKIAKKLGTTPTELSEANPETKKPGYVLKAGTSLKVPTDAKNVAEFVSAMNVMRMQGLVENAEYPLKIMGLAQVLQVRGTLRGPVPQWDGTRFVEQTPDTK